MQAEERHGFEGDGFVYLRSPMWWAGIICCMNDPEYRPSGTETRELTTGYSGY